MVAISASELAAVPSEQSNLVVLYQIVCQISITTLKFDKSVGEQVERYFPQLVFMFLLKKTLQNQSTNFTILFVCTWEHIINDILKDAYGLKQQPDIISIQSIQD